MEILLSFLLLSKTDMINIFIKSTTINYSFKVLNKSKVK